MTTDVSQNRNPAILQSLVKMFQSGGMPLVLIFGAIGVILLTAIAVDLPSFGHAATLALAAISLLLCGALFTTEQFKIVTATPQPFFGSWWERVTPDSHGSAVSFIDLQPDPTTEILKLRGRVFNGTGDLIAHWESTSSCYDPTAAKVFYYWSGQVNEGPVETGYGEFTFDFTHPDRPAGHGIFSKFSLDTAATVAKDKPCELTPASSSDLAVMHGNDAAAIKQRVSSKLTVPVMV